MLDQAKVYAAFEKASAAEASTMIAKLEAQIETAGKQTEAHVKAAKMRAAEAVAKTAELACSLATTHASEDNLKAVLKKEDAHTTEVNNMISDLSSKLGTTHEQAETCTKSKKAAAARAVAETAELRYSLAAARQSKVSLNAVLENKKARNTEADTEIADLAHNLNTASRNVETYKVAYKGCMDTTNRYTGDIQLLNQQLYNAQVTQMTCANLVAVAGVVFMSIQQVAESTLAPAQQAAADGSAGGSTPNFWPPRQPSTDGYGAATESLRIEVLDDHPAEAPVNASECEPVCEAGQAMGKLAKNLYDNAKNLNPSTSGPWSEAASSLNAFDDTFYGSGIIGGSVQDVEPAGGKI
ncbi:hypothetical protein LPJ53_006093 [Coemansia erecta]|uniref:Uncharacterized protein n=1 Tax=Coemansia erecta TaxID=147472 RepID=A0A9W7XV41_9FUNG|nr:hypothetical protein LPJ53_006093 [Coemansia erecta]